MLCNLYRNRQNVHMRMTMYMRVIVFLIVPYIQVGYSASDGSKDTEAPDEVHSLLLSLKDSNSSTVQSLAKELLSDHHSNGINKQKPGVGIRGENRKHDQPHSPHSYIDSSKETETSVNSNKQFTDMSQTFPNDQYGKHINRKHNLESDEPVNSLEIHTSSTVDDTDKQRNNQYNVSDYAIGGKEDNNKRINDKKHSEGTEDNDDIQIRPAHSVVQSDVIPTNTVDGEIKHNEPHSSSQDNGHMRNTDHTAKNDDVRNSKNITDVNAKGTIAGADTHVTGHSKTNLEHITSTTTNWQHNTTTPRPAAYTSYSDTKQSVEKDSLSFNRNSPKTTGSAHNTNVNRGLPSDPTTKSTEPTINKQPPGAICIRNQYSKVEVVTAAVGGLVVGGAAMFILLYSRRRCSSYYNGDYQRVSKEFDFELNPRFKTHTF